MVLLVLLALALAAASVVRGLLFPFKTCRRCAGRRTVTTGRGRPKTCRRCRGLGVRPRLIGKAARALREIQRHATGEEIRHIRL